MNEEIKGNEYFDDKTCILQLKNAINGSIFHEYLKIQNMQVVYKNLHIDYCYDLVPLVP